MRNKRRNGYGFSRAYAQHSILDLKEELPIDDRRDLLRFVRMHFEARIGLDFKIRQHRSIQTDCPQFCTGHILA